MAASLWKWAFSLVGPENVTLASAGQRALEAPLPKSRRRWCWSTTGGLRRGEGWAGASGDWWKTLGCEPWLPAGQWHLREGCACLVSLWGLIWPLSFWPSPHQPYLCDKGYQQSMAESQHRTRWAAWRHKANSWATRWDFLCQAGDVGFWGEVPESLASCGRTGPGPCWSGWVRASPSLARKGVGPTATCPILTVSPFKSSFKSIGVGGGQRRYRGSLSRQNYRGN